MGAKHLDGIPLAAIGVESAPRMDDLPLWYVPPDARRAAWSDEDPELGEEGRAE
jgi:hypothetical protein